MFLKRRVMGGESGGVRGWMGRWVEEVGGWMGRGWGDEVGGEDEGEIKIQKS
jgi:hypothetical protein